jgi:vacuolar-type H+-ATPase subunit H
MDKGWTIETYAAHNEALREAADKLDKERDRRYAEVKNAEEKALKVKEDADNKALGLAREIQTYKDEKANQLREQISAERGHYATQDQLKAATDRIEAMLTPIQTFVSQQTGGSRGMRDMWGWIVAAVLAGAALFNAFAPHVAK